MKVQNRDIINKYLQEHCGNQVGNVLKWTFIKSRLTKERWETSANKGVINTLPTRPDSYGVIIQK